jgi:GNAT superfamily N-acetyltransferase
MPTANIRIAVVTDLDAIISLADELTREDAGTYDPVANLKWVRAVGPDAFAQRIASDTGCVLLALDGDTAVAYLSGALVEPDIYRAARIAELRALFVQAPYRGQGVGEQLVERFVSWAESNGAARLRVSAFAANTGALRFYERQGFAPHTITLERSIEP